MPSRRNGIELLAIVPESASRWSAVAASLGALETIVSSAGMPLRPHAFPAPPLAMGLLGPELPRRAPNARPALGRRRAAWEPAARRTGEQTADRDRRVTVRNSVRWRLRAVLAPSGGSGQRRPGGTSRQRIQIEGAPPCCQRARPARAEADPPPRVRRSRQRTPQSRTLPGLRIPIGSSASLIVRMIATPSPC